MKKFLSTCLLVLSALFIKIGNAQAQDFSDTASIYFEEIRRATGEHKELWGLDLYAPLIFVDRSTREVFSNFADTTGILKAQGKIFKGILPKTINISNTAVQWGGRNWAMVMLPLPKEKKARINILAHELFHRAQKSLNFFSHSPTNGHLDQKDGRVYIRLELEALKSALQAGTERSRLEHIGNALACRKARYSAYPGSDSTENLLELNEGICEYTGIVISGRSESEMRQHFLKQIDRFIASPSYMRSFAYETIPIYGYLLQKKNKNWNKEINGKTILHDYFKDAFSLSPVNDVTGIIKNYNGELILKEENEREQRINIQLANYRADLIISPHIEIPLQKMNMSFDFTRILQLDTLGTVYPQIRITDNWGILEVEKGALISPTWKKVNISAPLKIEGNHYSGDGWKLELKQGYSLQKDEVLGNFFLKEGA